MGLTGAHALHVLSVFQHVDGLLASVEKLAQADQSPLAPERPDVTPDEARVLVTVVASARQRMLKSLDRLAIARPSPKISARWSIHTALRVAELSLSELNAARLRAYGAASPAAVRELEAIAADLMAVLREGAGLLQERG